MQFPSESDPIVAWQDGSLDAARQIVSAHQAELLGVAYLLAGDGNDAIALAETAFLRLFNQTLKGDPDINPRLALLNLAGQAYLRDDYRNRVVHDAGGLLAGTGPARFQVDNRGTLLLAALGRLERRERATLVLREFSGLEASEITRLQEGRDEPLVAPVETARQRVRQSVDIPAGEPLRPALAEATFTAPRIELWSRLEDDVTALQERSRNQSRAISIAIVAVVLAVLTGGLLVLLYDGETADSGGIGAAPLVTVEPTSPPATPATAIQPAPTPEPAPEAFVPSWLLVETTRQEVEGGSYRSLAIFDPRLGRNRRIPANSPIRLAAGADEVRLSPDGYQMVFFREQQQGDTMQYVLSAYSTDSIARMWETEVLALDIAPENLLPASSHVPVRFTAAVTGNRVYTAFLTTDSEPRLEVHAYFSRNGMPRGSASVDLPLQTPDSRFFRGNIQLHAPPEGDHLYLLVESFGDSVDEWRAALMTFDRHDLSLLSERSISAAPNQGYWLWESQMTPDGTALYGVYESRVGNQTRVQFLDLLTGEVTALPLPFSTATNRLESTLTVQSHGGRYIYVLDRRGERVAVVDLERRDIDRIFPLDRSAEVGELLSGQADLIFGSGSALSADGSRLFIASWDHDGSIDPRRQLGVWVIDTSRWELTGFIQVGGMVDALYLSPASNALHARVWPEPYNSPRAELVTIVTDDAPAVVERFDLPEEGSVNAEVHAPAQIYRDLYGRSPAIDYVPLADLAEYSTLPNVAISTGDDVAAVGRSTTVSVQVTDPATGEPVGLATPHVRHDPASSIIVTLHRDGQPPQVIFLSEPRPGIFDGFVSLPAAGTWTAEVTITATDGTTSTYEDAGTVVVAPALEGSDGQAYTFNTTTTPDQPYTREMTLVSVVIVNAGTGESLPDGVTVDIFDGSNRMSLPEQVSLRLSPGESGMVSGRLFRDEAGIYQGTVSFWSTGKWTATIEIDLPDGSTLSIPAGEVMVSG